MNKTSFLKFMMEQMTDKENFSTNLSDIGQKELRRLSTMNPERREQELIRKKRKERLSIKSPRLRALLMQKTKIEQQIQIEKDKLQKSQGK